MLKNTEELTIKLNQKQEKYKEKLSKKLAKRNPTKLDLEMVNTYRSLLKSSKQSLTLREYWRKENGVRYNNLFKAVCKRGPFGLI